jgi:hypothetical protein
MPNDVTAYASQLRDALQQAPVPPPVADLDHLVITAQALDAALVGDPVAVDPARVAWEQARTAIEDKLVGYLLGALADVPGLAALATNLGDVAKSGIHGELDLGPVHLSVSSASLVLQPPPLPDGTQPPPIPIGPFQIGEIAASLVSPFGGGSGMPGGGSIVRLPGDGGYGGTLELPLGPIQVSASAVLAIISGQPSFLAILGITFVPPIQLSFGFSLDRVGGIVGVNRRADVDALQAAVRTGTAGDVLFATRPPSSPLALISAANGLFPAQPGSHLVGPSLRISWLSFGPPGSLLSLDLGVIVQIPSGKVVILGVARASIPGLPLVLNLRLDLLGVIDPDQQLVSVDASLVDSHVLGIFEVYGDAAMRFCWAATGYMVVSVGGFYPGFNPEPAHIPALRRVGLSIDNPISIIEIRAEGYFAITSNSIQFGGRLEVGIDLIIEAHGFVQVDAIVIFRPFHFNARVSAGFDVSVEGFSFASVTLSGSISGPGPVVIDGSLSIDVFLFSISWDQSFTLGSGPSDTLPSPPRLLLVIEEELGRSSSVHAHSIGDPEVVLKPRPGRDTVAAVPPTGTLRVEQRRAPLGVLIERVDGRPLDGHQGVIVQTPGTDATERFSPGSYANLTDAEALNRPPFDVLASGRVLSLPDPPLTAFANTPEDRHVHQIVIREKHRADAVAGVLFDLSHMAAITAAARRPPALSDASPLVTTLQEAWTTASGADAFTSATAAHQFARYHGTVAVTVSDVKAPVSLMGVI